MAVVKTRFFEPFDNLDTKAWYVSDYAIRDSWTDTAFSPDNVTVSNGRVELRLDTDDLNGKEFTGAEIQTMDARGYGLYDVSMRASGQVGVNSSFFTYTGPSMGNPWNEIDIEILGKDPTKIHIAYHNDGESFEKDLSLGFDASKGFHDYAIDWRPDQITWMADGKAIYTVESPSIPVPTVEGKLIMNIWTGMNSWLGTPTFSDHASAAYDNASFTPYTPGSKAPVVDDKVSIFLINADTDQVIGQIEDGATIDSAAIGTNSFSILVQPKDQSAKSVVFDLDGPYDHKQVENVAPYALFGDSGSNYWGRTLSAGDYDVEVDVFSDVRGGGSKLASIDWDLTII